MKHVRRSFCSNIVVALAILMLSSSAAYAQTSLIYSFDAADQGLYGPFPASVMAQGPDGNLYGTTYSGGINTYGGIFVVTPSGSETVLHEFTSDDGRHCNMGLTLGNDTNFYGACYDGGTSNEGEIYKVTTGGVLTILHSFTNSGSDGAAPNAPPIQAGDGNFYGTTIAGGTNHDGTIYKLTPARTLTTIHSIGIRPRVDHRAPRWSRAATAVFTELRRKARSSSRSRPPANIRCCTLSPSPATEHSRWARWCKGRTGTFIAQRNWME